MAAQIPNNIRDPEALAEDVYTTWRQIMITDKVIKPDHGWPSWSALSADWKRTLIEAMKMCCTDDLDKVQEQINTDQLDFNFLKEEKSQANAFNRRCYVCGKEYATNRIKGVGVCAPCGGSPWI